MVQVKLMEMGKHGMPAGESSSGAPYKRAKISEPTRNDYLVGRRSCSDYRPCNVHRAPEMSHSDALTLDLPRDRLEGILKKGKPEETPNEDPKGDLHHFQVPLNDIKDVKDLVGDPDDIDAVTSLFDLRGSRHSFLSSVCVTKGDRTSSSMVVNADEPRRSPSRPSLDRPRISFDNRRNLGITSLKPFESPHPRTCAIEPSSFVAT